MSRYRNAGKQQVIVQHVNVSADKAAVAIGANALPMGGAAENGAQPYGPNQLTHEPGIALRCEDAARDALPIAGNAERTL